MHFNLRDSLFYVIISNLTSQVMFTFYLQTFHAYLKKKYVACQEKSTFFQKWHLMISEDLKLIFNLNQITTEGEISLCHTLGTIFSNFLGSNIFAKWPARSQTTTNWINNFFRQDETLHFWTSTDLYPNQGDS